MSSRQAFIGRLRLALGGDDYEPRIPLAEVADEPPRARFIGAPAGIEGFTVAWEALGGVVHHAPDGASLPAAVATAIDGRGPVLIGADPLVRQLEGDLRWPECGMDGAATAQVGVVGVRAGVAATGSLVMDAAFGRGRAPSLLPPIGVFVVRAGAIVDTPSDVLRDIGSYYPEGPPSQIVLITGPSRSADIEMTLTVGVHGPGEVHAVILGDG